MTNITHSVTSEVMKRRLYTSICTLLAMMTLVSCGRRNARSPLDRGGVDSRDFAASQYSQGLAGANQNARLAAILATHEPGSNRISNTTNCSPWEQNCNQQNSNGGRHGWEQGNIQNPNGSNGNLTRPIQDVGKVMIASLFEGATPLLSVNSRIATGTSGRILGVSRVLEGIRPSTPNQMGSQIAYSSEGSSIFVTTSTGNIWVIPAYENGALGQPYPRAVGGATFEIASARTPEGELIVASKSDGSIAILALDRIDRYTGSSVARVHDTNFPLINVGRVTSLAFSPTGEWLFAGVNQSIAANARNGGLVLTCHVPTMIRGQESPIYARTSFQLGRGCSTSIPLDLRNNTAPRFSVDQYGIGMQNTQHVPYKLAVSPVMAAFINPFVGPYRLSTPDIADMYPQKDALLREGVVAAGGINTRFPNQTGVLATEFRDIFVHPKSENLVVATKDTISSIYMDNRFSQQKSPPSTQIAGADIMGMALDPGSLYTDGTPDLTRSEFALVADRGNRRIWIANLNNLTVALDTSSDFVQIGEGAPLDVAVRTRARLNARAATNNVLPTNSSENPNIPAQ